MDTLTLKMVILTLKMDILTMKIDILTLKMEILTLKMDILTLKMDILTFVWMDIMTYGWTDRLLLKEKLCLYFLKHVCSLKNIVAGCPVAGGTTDYVNRMITKYS